MTVGSEFSSFETLLLERQNAIAVLTLNRPDRLNVMNLSMRDELRTALDEVRDHAEIRALVVTGAGDAFCAGGDVNDFVERSAEEMHDLMRDRSHRWFRALWDLPIPVVSAVNGVAAGGGISVLLASDFVLAAETAKMGQTFVRVGLMPDLGGLSMLPRSIGLHRAKAMALTGELIPAQRAYELGLVYAVVPAELVLERAVKLAETLAGGPRHAYAATKSLLNHSFERSLEEVLEGELYAQSYLFSTRDHQELLGRFLDRPSIDEEN